MANITRTTDHNLTYGASSQVIELARELRRSSTKAEKVLWDKLRGKKLGGLKFRRQHAIKWYVVDFYCHESRLAIEIDGRVHEDEEVQSRDNKRTIDLEELGVFVIRFTNDEIFNHLSEVLDEIARTASRNLD